MIKRLIFLTVIILAGLVAVAGLGFHALGKWQQGLVGERLAQFAQTAERIGADVKQQLDVFLEREQKRPYTDYLYYHVTGAQPSQQQALTVRSSLGGRLDHDLAYGHFQIEPDKSILTPNDGIIDNAGASVANWAVERANQKVRARVAKKILPHIQVGQTLRYDAGDRQVEDLDRVEEMREQQKALSPSTLAVQSKRIEKGQGMQAPALPIDSLQMQQQDVQVLEQNRSVYWSNTLMNESQRGGQSRDRVVFTRPQEARQEGMALEPAPVRRGQQGRGIDLPSRELDVSQQDSAKMVQEPLASTPFSQDMLTEATEVPVPGTVKIRIEPLVPIQVDAEPNENSIFGNRVYLVRHVQVEDRHLLQGFQLNEALLLERIRQSADRFMREGMTYTLSRLGSNESTYQRRLDFGFGGVVLGLHDLDPLWIEQRVRWLRSWYAGTLGVVLLVVGLGLASLWRGAHQQMTLARKKDDFISAVSHELRTPLTSIRMYAEMLEQGWVPTEEKQQDYFGHIRQESERLSRLIENVLDFSRMQRGRKRFTFDMGDLNDCVTRVVDMMVPYALERGFRIHTDLPQKLNARFDRDAVTQIVVNLLDNAIKYADSAQDKSLTVRVYEDQRFVYLEVEDHGPGVAHSQRAKIFEQFYRTEDEATRQTQGTGLGLALVERFAQAHQGYVKLRTAHPSGAIFTVALGKGNRIQ